MAIKTTVETTEVEVGDVVEEEAIIVEVIEVGIVVATTEENTG